MRRDILVSWSAFKTFDLGGHKTRFAIAEGKSCYDVLSSPRVLLLIFGGGEGVGGNMFLEIAKKKTLFQYLFLSSWSKHAWQYLHLPGKKVQYFPAGFWNPLKTSVTCYSVFKVIEAKLWLREKWGIQCNWRNSIAMLHRFSKRSTFPPGINIAFIMKLNKHFF